MRTNNKIIGFTVAKNPIDHNDVDVFGVGLHLLTFERSGFHIYLWGMGDIRSCFIDENTVSLSFPLHASLLDRNVLITFEYEHIVIENDWLGSIPVFYNSTINAVSTRILKVAAQPDIDPEGLADYLDAGYVILEHTPIKEVRFMRYFSRIKLTEEELSLEHKDDPVLHKLERGSTPEDAIRELDDYIQKAESMTTGTIIIPTSGGFDSRLLNTLVHDRPRIVSSTYGISNDQEKSFEVVRARKISEILGTKWYRVALGDFHNHEKEWYSLFGPSAHLHGMYHIEFYQALKNEVGQPATVLSGIIGDAWSGNVTIPPIKKPNDLISLAYAHGMNFTRRASKRSYTNQARQDFLNEHREDLNNEAYRIVMSMRFKIVLLSYLMSIPDYCGFPTWTPYLSLSAALHQLDLPQKDRIGRAWQKDFFAEKGLDIENMDLACSHENTLNLQALQKNPLPMLDITTLSRLIKPGALHAVNRSYQRIFDGPTPRLTLLQKFYRTRIGAGIARRAHINTNILKPYYQLLVLKPLEYFFSRP